MSNATLAGVMAALAADPARTRKEREALQRALVQVGSADRGDCLLTMAEAARRLNRSKTSVHSFARRGILRKVRLPGFRQNSGIMRSEIERLAEYIAGRGEP